MFHCGFFTSVLLVLSVWPEVASSFSACVSSVFVLSKVQHNIIVLIRCTPHSTSLHEGCCCSHLCQALSFHLQTQLSGCSNLTSCPLSLLSLPASLSLLPPDHQYSVLFQQKTWEIMHNSFVLLHYNTNLQQGGCYCYSVKVSSMFLKDKFQDSSSFALDAPQLTFFV